MKSIHKCLFTGHFHCYIWSFKKGQKQQKHPFWSHSPMPSCRKRLTWLCRKWDPVNQSMYKLEAKIDIFVSVFWQVGQAQCLLIGTPIDPDVHLVFIAFLSPEVQQVSQKRSPFLIGESLDGFCHLVAIIHQSHRKPEGQGHWGEVNEPNVAHPLDPVSKFDPKCFRNLAEKIGPWKVRQKTMSTERCRQIWVKKSYWKTSQCSVSQWFFHGKFGLKQNRKILQSSLSQIDELKSNRHIY